jgi:hypothetical protein
MQSVDFTDLLDFDLELERILAEMPAQRRFLHEQIGQIIKEDVDDSISASGLNIQHGNARRWQIVHIGTKGGYAAVRAAGSKDGPQVKQITTSKGTKTINLELTGPNSAGAITNYIVSGHRVRPSKLKLELRSDMKKADRLKSQSHDRRVPGYNFYYDAQASTEAKVISAIEGYVDKLSAKVGG